MNAPNALDLMSLKGRIALITGANQGIGKAIAVTLGGLGADIIIHCKDELESAAQTAESIREFGVRTDVITGDLSHPDTPGQIFSETSRIASKVDILVLNVSVQIRKNWQATTVEEMDYQISVNLKATLQLVQLFSKQMQQQHWGRIIIVGSIQQLKPHPEMIVYAATKAALSNMVKNLARQLGPFGINVNTIAPGVIITNRNEQALAQEEYREKLIAGIPVGFLGTPEDCAPLAGLLASNAGRYITGQDFFIDGGMSL